VTVAQFFVAAGGFLVALGAVSAAVGLLAKSAFLGRPLRWLWRTNVSTPIGEWHRTGVRDVVDERIEHLMHNRNGGSSLLDLAEAVEAVKAQVNQVLKHDAERDKPGLRYDTEETSA
jgi:hypothetical protein